VESNHAPPPYQSGACPVGLPSMLVRISPGGFEPPSPTVAGWCSVPLSYGESERSRRESNPPHPGDSRAAPPGASESVNGAPGNRTPLGWLQATILATKSPARATAGDRTRSAALATPCASVLTPRSHVQRPERGSNPRHRCERPASWPTRRPGRE
jgi:hypothetical protein